METVADFIFWGSKITADDDCSHEIKRGLLLGGGIAPLTATPGLYKKDLHDQNNHDGVITHLDPDILECEVKWTLESITMHKASGGDGFQLSYFKS